MSIQTPTPEAVGEPRLTRGRKIAYGMGDMGGSVVFTITGFFLAVFLLDVVGLRPAAFGIIFLAAQIWDALLDPIVGVLTDRTRSRWGSKRPWLLFGAIPFGLAYFLHWLVPDLGPTGLFFYYLVVALLLRTAFTIVYIPYGALTPVLTRDYDERTQLNVYRFALNLFASLLAVALHPVLVGLGGNDERLGYLISGGVWAVFIVLVVLTAFRFTYELPPATSGAPESQRQTSFLREIWQPLRSRAFLYLVGIYLLSWTCVLLVQNNLLLYMRYWAGAEEHFVGIVLTFQVAVILSLGVWARVSDRIGKRWVYVIGAVIWMAGLLSLFFMPRDAATPYYFAAIFVGVGAAVAYLVPWSMLPDVIEEDELRTGRRREGVFYAMLVLLQKTGPALGIAASSFALEAAGYVNPEVPGELVEQPESILTTLRIFVSLVPIGLLAVSIPLVLLYPITRERFDEIRRSLKERALDKETIGGQSD